MTTPRLLYALFMLLALAAFLLARRGLRSRDPLLRLPWQTRFGLGLAAFVGGTLGAKVPFALAHPDGPLRGAAWLADGKTIVTGLIGAYLAVELAKWLLGVTTKTGDAYALPLALALAVGRWGCFCNGCCYGTETALPWAVPFQVPGPDGETRVALCHPTQAYESLFHLAMVFCLAWLMGRGLLPGQRLKLYLIAYGVYRFATEFIRPEPAWWLGLTFYQWASLVLVTGLCAQWLFDRQAATGAAGAPAPALTAPAAGG
jgi:phosphatidylglycerol:prolipoprotein diacylglycerol transferase